MRCSRFLALIVAALLSACAALPSPGPNAIARAPIVAVDQTDLAAPVAPVERAELAPIVQAPALSARGHDDGYLHIKLAQLPSDQPLFADAPQPVIACNFASMLQSQPFPTALCPFGTPGSATSVNTTAGTMFNSAGNLVYAPNNQIRNSTMQGAAVADLQPETVTNGNFALNPLSPSQNTVLNGWQWKISGGTTATVVWNGSSTVTLTGDGTNGALLSSIPLSTVVGQVYTVTLTVSGANVSVWAGTTAFANNLTSATAVPGTGQTVQFTATATTSFVTFVKTSTQGAIVSNVSVKSAGVALNGSFSLNPVSASQNTVQNGWQWQIAGGTSAVGYGANAVTITGDGTNEARFGTAALTTIAGHTYTITADITGNVANVRVGTSFDSAGIFQITSGTATGQKFQFIASGTTTYLTFVRSSIGAASIANVSVVDAGMVPSGWAQLAVTDGSGLTETIVGLPTDNGNSCIAIAMAGTATASHTFNIQPISSAAAPAAAGQTWVAAYSEKIISGSTTGFNNILVATDEANSSGNFLASHVQTISLTSTLTRFSVSSVFSNSSTANAYTVTGFGIASGQTVNLTVEICAPQLEIQTPAQGGTPSPFYATSGTAYFGPRMDYDPSTSPATALGYRPEQQHTNLVTASFDQFSNATYWTIGQGTVTDSNASGPMGSNTLSTYADNTSLATHELSTAANISVTSGQTYVFSQLVKSGTDHLVQLDFNLSQFSGGGYANFDTNSCGVPVGSGGTFVAANGINEGGGICRVWMAATATATGNTTAFISRINSASATRHPSYAGTGTTILIGEADVIANPFPLSMAPTYGATTTVNADVMSITSLPGCLQNPQRVMITSKFTSAPGQPAGVNQYVYTLNDGTSNNRFTLAGSNTGFNVNVVAGGTNYGPTALIPSGFTSQTMKQWFTGYSGNYAAQIIGQAKGSHAEVVPTGLNTLSIGNSGSAQFLNGPIANLSLYCAANDNFAFQKASGQ